MRDGPRSAPPRPAEVASPWRIASSSASPPRGAAAHAAPSCGTRASPASVDLLGEATVTPGRGRPATPSAAWTAVGVLAAETPALARAAAARIRRRGRAAAGQPVREDLGAHPAAAPCPRPRADSATPPRGCGRCCARRATAARTCTSTWSRSTRARRCWSRARGARRGRVPRGPVLRPRAPGLPARLAGHAGPGARLGAHGPARLAAHGAAGEGRLLGSRARPGPPARLGGAGVRGQAGL